MSLSSLDVLLSSHLIRLQEGFQYGERPKPRALSCRIQRIITNERHRRSQRDFGIAAVNEGFSQRKAGALSSTEETKELVLSRRRIPFSHRLQHSKLCTRALANDVATPVIEEPTRRSQSQADVKREAYDAVVIGSGIGGIVAACQLAIRGASVVLLEKYVIPGGSSGYFEKEGYTFDVGSSVMFGFGSKGNVNLITRALAAVGRKMELIEDPTAVHYHMPNGLSVKVHRGYDEFLAELVSRFPGEEKGIRRFYGECWTVFNALNALELKSLEEPLYLLGQFIRSPLACLTLAWYLPQNAGDIARKYISDPDVLAFIDAECFIVSTVDACRTPMINAAMVLCDRHFGGINYPTGGVGRVAQELVAGLQEHGGRVEYCANVTQVVVEGGKGVGVKLSDGRQIEAKAVISNATRWDTFEKLVPTSLMPREEQEFQQRYRRAPSFLSIHMGVDAAVLPQGTECHHLLLESSWARMEEPYETIFLSIPTILDPSLAPPGRHILHIFTTAWMDDWQGFSPSAYKSKKEDVADRIVARLEQELFPGLQKATHFREIGTPKTHRRYLARDQGTYGPIPSKVPRGLLGMPFNTTALEGLYCVGDSCFPGQGVIAVAFSGIMCGHRVAADLGLEPRNALLDKGLGSLLRWFRTLA
eukprot:TRINITY_DN16994_c0_g1_i1.p1 TRINITY_DN16994_c0_g1~~TRINITY_DN16994_c0_g1_i1.p1  ORF type:complete len:646 (-),score=98.20 TRINITY_DN16994_c0_g1_i1:751-2688(-)